MMYAIPQGAPVILVHAHSNGCDIGDMRQTLQSISESLRVHVMSFEYPGYGLHLGSPNMRSIDEAANAVLNFLLNDMKVNPAQIVWYGRSIGSGPATRLAHRLTKEHKVRPGGLIIQCGFANFKEVAGFLFGRWAKRFVSPLWPNETMVKDLNCPVLVIHGRADKMIPISQAEQLWKAVVQKDHSKFHACECGHNDFNFQLCTLRPIYEFLVAVISTPSFPAQNFKIEIDPSRRSFVRHVAPLRDRIPAYTFRRPELEEWMKSLQAKKLQPVDAAVAKNLILENGTVEDAAGNGKVTASAQAESPQPATVAESEDDAGPRVAGGKEASIPEDGGSAGSPKQPTALAKDRKAKSKGKADKKKAEPFEIPNYCELPPSQDITEALFTSEGMVRTCAHRVERFLERVQQRLNDIVDLEMKPVSELVELVEAEFYASDPLMCLWEEVTLPTGEVSRFRLGPFFVSNSGEAGYSPELPGESSADVLRIPLWVFSLSPAHYRYLTEWSLLHSERISRNLPDARSRTCFGPCCCCASSSSSAQPARKRKKKADSRMSHPTRGVLATLLAAHYVSWVEKNEEIRVLLAKFAELHRRPEDSLRLHPAPGDVHTIPGGRNPIAPLSEVMARLSEEARTPPHAVVGAQPLPQERVAQNEGVTVPKPPWHPRTFNAMGRDFLLERLSTPGVLLEASLLQLWGCCEDIDGITPATDSEGKAVPEFGDCAAALDTLARPASDRSMDWVVSNVLLHYERQLRPTINPDKAEQKIPADALRSDGHVAVLSMNRAMRAFVHAKQRERRELERRKLRPPPTPHKLPATVVATLPSQASPDGTIADLEPTAAREISDAAEVPVALTEVQTTAAPAPDARRAL